MVKIPTSEVPLEYVIRKKQTKFGVQRSVLTTATASFTHGPMTAGPTIPKVKPGLGTRHPSGKAGTLAAFRVFVCCTYSSGTIRRREDGW